MANEPDVSARWSAELVRRVGRAIKEARRGKSAAWLSERTAELGFRISPTVIAKLDSGHRGAVLSVAELLVLAAALEVPPVALLFPDLPDGDVEALPNVKMRSEAAMQWLSGEQGTMPFGVVTGSESGGTTLPVSPKSDLVEAVRWRSAIVKELMTTLRLAKDDPRFADGVSDLEGGLRKVNAKIRALGGVATRYDTGSEDG